MKRKLTKEESEHLISLGIPKTKASDKISYGYLGYIPIFTLTDILNIIPKVIDFDNNLNIHINPIESVVYYDEHFDDFHSLKTELIDALYEVLCWVIENRLNLIVFEDK